MLRNVLGSTAFPQEGGLDHRRTNRPTSTETCYDHRLNRDMLLCFVGASFSSSASGSPCIVFIQTRILHVSKRLTHLLEEVGFLDFTPAIVPHRLCQLLPCLAGLSIASHRSVSLGEINALFVHRHFRRQRLRIEQLLLPQGLGCYPSLLLRFGCKFSQLCNISYPAFRRAYHAQKRSPSASPALLAAASPR